MSETVTLTHPDLPKPIEVGHRKARILVRQGWAPAAGQTVPERSDAEPSRFPAPPLADPAADDEDED